MGYHYYQSKPGFKPQMDNTPKNTKIPDPKSDDKERRRRQKTTGVALSILMVIATLVVGYEVIFQDEAPPAEIASLEPSVSPSSHQIDKVQALRKQLIETNQKLQDHQRKLFAKSNPKEQEKLAEISHELSEKVKLNETYEGRIQKLEKNKEELKQTIAQMEDTILELTELSEVQDGTHELVSAELTNLEDNLKTHRESLWHTNIELEEIKNRAEDLQNQLEAQYEIEGSFKNKIAEISGHLEAEKYNKQSVEELLQALLTRQDEREKQMETFLETAAKNDAERNEEFQKLLTHNENLSQDYVDMEYVLDIITRANDNLNQEQQKLELAIRNERENTQRLENELKNALALHNEVDNSNEKLTSIETALQLKEKELEELSLQHSAHKNQSEVQIAQFQEEINNLIAKHEAETKNVNSNSQLLAESQATIATMEKLLEDASQSLEKLMQENNALSDSLLVEKSRTENEQQKVLALEEDLQKKVNTLTFIQEHHADQTAELNLAHEEIAQFQKEIASEQQKSLAMEENLRNKMSGDANKSEELAKYKQELASEQQKALALEEDLQNRISTDASKSEELAKYKQELASEQQKALALEEDLQNRISTDASKSEELAKYKQELASEQQKALALEEDLQNKISTDASKTEELAKYKQELASEQQKALALGEDLQNRISADASKTEELAKYKQELASEQQKALALEEDLQNKISTDASKTEELTKYKQELDAERQKTLALQEELQAKIIELTSHHEQQSQEKIAQFQQQLDGLKLKLASEQQKSSKYRQEIEQNINELTSLMKTLSTREEEILSLKKEQNVADDS